MTVAASAFGLARGTSALARSCHPAPTVAVTVFVTVLGVTAHNSAGTCAILAAAALCGQLSIGWTNDRYDAGRDRAAGREDKPLAQGEIALRTADAAIVAVALVTVALSLALGWRAGLLHIGAVACGWIYNFWLKSTWWSWLPYAVAFGALPGIATLALPTHPGPALWVIAAGALLGVAANLTNALPDLAGDARTGVSGLPHRIGPRPSLVLATALLISATVIVVFGPRGSVPTLAWALFGVVVVAAIAGLGWAWRRPTSKSAFYGIMASVAVDIVLIALNGKGLH